MALKVAEIQKIVKDTGFDLVLGATENVEVVQYADHSIAVKVEVEGKPRWAKISVVCGQLSDTKATNAFNPYDARDAWEFDKEVKAKIADQKAKEKAEKLAKKGK